MRHGIAGLTMIAIAAAGCARSATVESTGEVTPAPAPAPATSDALPIGSTLHVRLDESIGTANNHVGDSFTATVTNEINAADGSVVIPSGSKVSGKVTGLDDSDNATDPAVIKLDFDSISINGVDHPFEAKITATELQRQGADTRDETVRKAAIGAAAGAVLGAVLGDVDLKSILVGGALGAAAGTAISLGTGDVEAVLPQGTMMTIRSTQEIAVR
jgi:hypothetical protein